MTSGTPTIPMEQQLQAVAEGVLTVEETAAFLKCSVREVYKQMESRGLPYFPLGRYRKVPKLALQQWCVQQGIVGSF